MTAGSSFINTRSLVVPPVMWCRGSNQDLPWLSPPGLIGGENLLGCWADRVANIQFRHSWRPSPLLALVPSTSKKKNANNERSTTPHWQPKQEVQKTKTKELANHLLLGRQWIILFHEYNLTQWDEWVSVSQPLVWESVIFTGQW